MATLEPHKDKKTGPKAKEHFEELDNILARQIQRRVSFEKRYPSRTVKPDVVPWPGSLFTPADKAKAVNELSARTFPRLSRETRNRHLTKHKKALNLRIEKYLKGIDFPTWSLDKREDVITEEFAKLNLLRQHIWYKNLDELTLESRPDFEISQALLENNGYRKPHLIAFDYSKTDKTYNSNTVLLGGLTFFALEAPSRETVKDFRNLIHNHEVKTLVRLTAEREGSVEKGFVDKCYNYWDGHLSLDGTKLKIPLESERSTNIDLPYEVHYLATNNWDDSSAGNAKELLVLIFEAREYYDPAAPIAVHCHSGVARTGTFITGLALMREIDRQIAEGVRPDKVKINVASFVLEGSLQRFYFIGQPQQYVTVHRMLDLYIKGLLNYEYKSNYKQSPIADALPLTEMKQLRNKMNDLEKKHAQEVAALRREIEKSKQPVTSKNEGILFAYNIMKYVAGGIAFGLTLHTLTKSSNPQPN